MQHGEYVVHVYDADGNPVGSKPRKDVDRKKDIVHCIDVFVFDAEGSMVLGRIPENNEWVPRAWAPPAATMLRVGESAEAAAARTLQKELGITGEELHNLGEHFFVYDDGVKRWKTTFWIRTNEPLHPNPEDVSELKSFTRAEIESAMPSDPAFHPILDSLWGIYGGNLPL